MTVNGPSMQKLHTRPMSFEPSPASSWIMTSRDDVTPRAIQPRRKRSESIFFILGRRFITALDMGIDATKLTATHTTVAIIPGIVGLTL